MEDKMDQKQKIDEKKDWFSKMSFVDEAFVEEAMGRERKAKKRSKIKIGIFSSVAVVAAVLVVALLLPLSLKDRVAISNIGKNQNKAGYQTLARVLSDYKWSNQKDQTRLDQLVGDVEGMFVGKGDSMDLGAMEMVPEAEGFAPNGSAPNLNQSYEEVTDLQVDGVIEGDIFKRSSDYIYYLHENSIYAYSIKGEESSLVGSYSFDAPYYDDAQMYLTQDCGTLIVMVSGEKGETFESYVTIIAIDVTNPSEMTEKKIQVLPGILSDTRYTEDGLILATRTYVNQNQMDFSKMETYVPYYMEQGTEKVFIDSADIYYPDEICNLTYQNLFLLNPENLEMKDTASFLSYGNDLYVNQNTIVLNGTKYLPTGENEGETETKSSFLAVTYGEDGFTVGKEFLISGSVLNQYSMDIKDGIFRVVTSTRKEETKVFTAEDGEEYVRHTWIQNSDLTCVDLSNNEEVAKLVSFAPEGETVRSVRFDGDLCYVCTAIQTSDPVFYIDLSDLSDIKIKDTGTIEGFSSSLIQFGDGYLLGIGVNENWELKLEVYASKGDKVVSLDKKEYLAELVSEYKSYYINRELQLFGIPMIFNDEGGVYTLFAFDGNELIELHNFQLSEHFYREIERTRGVLIDGYFYLLLEDELRVEKIQ